MKKLMALLMACALSMSLLAGCGGGGSSSTAGSSAAGGSQASSGADSKPIKVAMGIAGALGDKGFNDSAKAGLDKAMEEFGVEAQVIELPTSDKTKFEPTLLDLADSGEYDLITAAGNAMREIVAGQYGVDYWLDLLKHLVFIPLALLLGLVLRKPLIRMNEFFEERLYSTQLM